MFASVFLLRKTYGNVYSLYLGSKPAVFINGVKAMREALITKATEFAGRPQDLYVNDTTDRKGVILADYGPSWREHRRFALMTLRNFGMGKNSMEDRIHGELQYIIKTLKESNGKSLSPQLMFHNAASNIICQVLFGRRYEYDDEFITLIVKCFTENAKLANGPWAMLYDSFPMIRSLPLPFSKAFKNVATCQRLAKQVLANHKKTRVPGEPRDFVDCYLDEMDKRGNDGSSFSEEQLSMYALDIHFAGTDTTSNTLLSGFLHLATHPQIQERCQEEIDRVLEGKERACFNDRHDMPYVQAVIHEVQRVANTVPLSVFHYTTKDTELTGYSIPKGTLIIPNLSSLLTEEGQWKYPHEFNPENFLNDQGEFVKPEAFMPFSAGPRMCLGEGLARMELFLITVTLLRKFKFSWPEGAGKPDYTPVYGVTLTPKPYHMKVQLRAGHHRSKNFPPGPRPIPIFGNLLDLNLENPIADLERLSKCYGNIFSIFIGPKPVVVLNGLAALKEALVNKAADFSGRPQEQLANHVTRIKAHAPGVVLADYNSGWKEQRRFGLKTLRDFGLGKRSMEQIIQGQLCYLIQLLEESGGKAMDPNLIFHNAASNIICQILFAKQFDYEDEFIKFSVGLFHETSKIINGPWSMIYESFPLLRNLPLPFQKAFKLIKMSYEKRTEMVAENKKTRIPGQPRHFIDCYLDELDKRGEDGSSFSEEQLCAIILDLHFAGTDTTANTLLAGFLYLMNYPHIQERCQQEIDRVLDGKDQPTFEDRHQMPYVQAVIHEIQRKANTVPLSVFHCTTKDTEIMGYSIPKGTMVIPNLTSVLNEEGQWKSPHVFDPENFLNEKGEFVKPEAFMPFSIGHRVCLGEGLARMELFITVVTLLRKFKFIWPEDAGEPDFTPVFGITQTPKRYYMKVQLR
ncbi:uncharacterized protein V6R79_021927 [Siganus canaliculatus]